MATIGLLGNEYDEAVKLLKVRIEDRGHRARVINLQHLPRVTRATVDFDRIVCDGYNLLEMDSFFLKEMDVRDPFFHVRYSRELWNMLRERYLSFAEDEVGNIIYIRNVLYILSARKPVINPPHVYEHRNQMPYHLSVLARRGFTVPPFITAYGGENTRPNTCSGGEESTTSGERRLSTEPAYREHFNGPYDELSLRMDEYRAFEVFSFPKGKEQHLRLLCGRGEGEVYKLIVIGDRPLEHAVLLSTDADSGRVVASAELPAGVSETAREAARAVGASFAEVELQAGAGEDAVMVRRVDPSPEFFSLEERYRLSIADPLANHLINAGGSKRA
jgi:hypothetical protein